VAGATPFADPLSRRTGTNETMARGFGERLRTVAGFKHVAEPLPMKNKMGAVV